MSARFAFAAVMFADEAVVGRAVEGHPGLAVEHGLGRFPTWTQANDFARRINESLGLSPSESRNIVAEATFTPGRLIPECRALGTEARELQQRINEDPVRLELALAKLDLAVTLCHSACVLPPPPEKLERLLAHARSTLANAVAAMAESGFTEEGVHQITAGIERLQQALEECADTSSEL